MKLGPGKDQAMLRLRKLPRYELDLVDRVDAIRVLVASMKVSAMMRLSRVPTMDIARDVASAGDWTWSRCDGH
jgi:hypothetical protein